MKTEITVEKTGQLCEPVLEMYFENTSSGLELASFYDGPDTPRESCRPRGNKASRIKSAWAVALALMVIKARELRGEFQGRRGEERKDILKTWEPKSWLHTLADTFARGGNDELGRVFTERVLRMFNVRGGRVSNMRIDRNTGKLPSLVCLDCRITEKFPACLRILVQEQDGGPYVAIQDAKKIMELAEKLEQTRGFWETHLLPLNLNSLEAKASQTSGTVMERASLYILSSQSAANHPIVRPQPWRERGESANFLRLKFELLTLIRAGRDNDCIALIESNPELCRTKLPPNDSCALITAIRYRQNRVVNYLLERDDVDVNRATDHGVTPLLMAANINNYNLIKLLAEKKKANCQVTNKMGANVIYEAAFGGGHDAYLIIKYFHEIWKIACDQQTYDAFLPLTLAVWRRCDERTIKYLIEHSADLNVADFYGETPYYKAIKYAYFEAVNLLINLGGSKLDRTKIPSRHVTDRASVLFAAVHHGDLKRVRQLLDEGNDDIDEAELEFERSPLHEAVDQGHLQIVDELIARGANVFIQNHHGRIPRDFLPWKRASIVQQIEDSLKNGEKEWIAREMRKLPGRESAI
jgi:ankyrin repeat protein